MSDSRKLSLRMPNGKVLSVTITKKLYKALQNQASKKGATTHNYANVLLRTTMKRCRTEKGFDILMRFQFDKEQKRLDNEGVIARKKPRIEKYLAGIPPTSKHITKILEEHYPEEVSIEFSTIKTDNDTLSKAVSFFLEAELSLENMPVSTFMRRKKFNFKERSKKHGFNLRERIRKVAFYNEVRRYKQYFYALKPYFQMRR